jgi:hypothetical protein
LIDASSQNSLSLDAAEGQAGHGMLLEVYDQNRHRHDTHERRQDR